MLWFARLCVCGCALGRGGSRTAHSPRSPHSPQPSTAGSTGRSGGFPARCATLASPTLSHTHALLPLPPPPSLCFPQQHHPPGAAAGDQRAAAARGHRHHQEGVCLALTAALSPSNPLIPSHHPRVPPAPPDPAPSVALPCRRSQPPCARPPPHGAHAARGRHPRLNHLLCFHRRLHPSTAAAA